MFRFTTHIFRTRASGSLMIMSGPEARGPEAARRPRSEEILAMKQYIVRRVGYSLLVAVLLSLLFPVRARDRGPGELAGRSRAVRTTSRTCAAVGSIDRRDSTAFMEAWPPATSAIPSVSHAGARALFQRLRIRCCSRRSHGAVSLIGIPEGILAACASTVSGQPGKIFALLGLSLPSFWSAVLILSSPSTSAAAVVRFRSPLHLLMRPSRWAGFRRRTCG